MGHCGSQFLTIPHSTWQPGPNRVGVISPLNSCNRQRTAGRRVRWRRGAVANAQWPLRVCVRAVCRVWGDVVIQSSKASSSSTLKILLTQSKSALRTRQAHVTTCTVLSILSIRSVGYHCIKSTLLGSSHSTPTYLQRICRASCRPHAR